ncbi:MAG TPA: GGDEF domain-containing protein [Gaiellales bacterium]
MTPPANDERATWPEPDASHDRRRGGHEIGRPARDHTEPAEEAADGRDRAAERRDRGAERRDAIARLLDEAGRTDSTLASLLQHAERDRARAAADRAHASDDRSRASVDRVLAARDRSDALAMRAEAASNLKLAATDGLTGVWTRTFGLEAAARELDRAHRTGHGVVLAFIDVDGLKQVNDEHGHLAGDALLRALGGLLLASLRQYDVSVRYGGDEFISVMSEISLPEARSRLDGLALALADNGSHHSFSFGLAEAGAHDTLDAMIAKADADLLAHRQHRRERDSA